jgi:hypothetical protein
LGTLVAETPVSGRRETGVSQTDVPKQEFGNEKKHQGVLSKLAALIYAQMRVPRCYVKSWQTYFFGTGRQPKR